jgi:hypothetical protein
MSTYSDSEFVSKSLLFPPAMRSFGRNQAPASQWCPSDWTIDQAAFDELLGWLDPDPEAAGRQYELIRRKLITVFTYKGCVFPEELADVTFNRVARKLPAIKPYYRGSPSRYFYGVAKKIYMEYQRNTPAQPILLHPNLKEDLEESLQRLDYALSKLTQVDRELILSYYREEGRGKIEHRKALAKQMGLHLNALRLRVCRIRSRLKKYFETKQLANAN